MQEKRGCKSNYRLLFFPAARSRRGLQSCQEQNSQKPLLTCRLRKVKMITCLEIGVLCRRIVGMQEQNRLWVTPKQSCSERDFIFIYWFLAKTGKILKCGRQVETLKYMHDFNVFFFEIDWFFCCPILLFSTRNQPANTFKQMTFSHLLFPLKKEKGNEKTSKNCILLCCIKKMRVLNKSNAFFL